MWSWGSGFGANACVLPDGANSYTKPGPLVGTHMEEILNVFSPRLPYFFKICIYLVVRLHQVFSCAM